MVIINTTKDVDLEVLNDSSSEKPLCTFVRHDTGPGVFRFPHSQLRL